MSRPSQKIDVERVHINPAVGHGLRGVEQHQRTLRMRPRDDLLDREHGPEHVGNESAGNHACALAELVGEIVHVQRPVFEDVDRPNDGAGFLGDQLPRDDIGVVFEHGEQDFIARAQVLPPPRLSDEVDGFGGVLGEDHLALVSAHEPGDLGARGLEGVGRLLAEPVHAPVDVGVGGFHELIHGVRDGQGLLRRGRRIKENQPLIVVDPALERRELRPDRGKVEAGGHGCSPAHRSSSPKAPGTPSHALTFSSSIASTASGKSSAAKGSRAKARISRARAVASLTPRARR